MKFFRLPLVTGLLAAAPAWAIYAPIPEQDQGKPLVVTVRGAVTHDSNIFGAPSGEIDSMVYSFNPKVAFNASVSDQTFLSAAYALSLDHFTDRPGKKTLDSHDLMARISHSFTAATTLDLTEGYSLQKNPESLLAGIPVNTDQSFKRNQFDGVFNTKPVEKMDLTAKFRSMIIRYDNNALSSLLDHSETLFGLSGGYAVQPDLKAVGEYRHLDISYRRSGFNRDKSSDFALVGGDYKVGKKLTSTARLGFEYRQREGEADETSPYAEFTGRYLYAQGSFLSAGYIYSLEETSNTLIYTDAEVNRFFVNLQHAITALVTLSGTLDYEPSTLNGRRGFRDVDETTTRLGLAASYLYNRNWTFSASYDYDKTSSDDPTRKLKRNRVGVAAIVAF